MVTVTLIQLPSGRKPCAAGSFALLTEIEMARIAHGPETPKPSGCLVVAIGSSKALSFEDIVMDGATSMKSRRG